MRAPAAQLYKRKIAQFCGCLFARKEKKKESKKENSMHGKMTTANRKEKRVVKSTSTNTLYYFQNVYEH
jgi:predicted adenine nucleotide alpha hydrolase (AANH) superfamily ATPase